MEILNANLTNLKQLVQKYAKFQKVMLIYDNFTSNTQILEIYNAIKEDCIFNQCNINSNLNEIYNGYKVLIFLCSANGFLSLNLSLQEFVCVFIPNDNTILPYFLNDQNTLSQNNNFLLITSNNLDISPICSYVFNNFYNYLQQLVYTGKTNVVFNFNFGEITQNTILNSFKNIKDNFVFNDVKILKACKLNYCDLPLLDYILICAFICMLENVYNNSLQYVDIYKAVGDNYDLLNNYYSLLNNKLLTNIIKLNYTGLSLSAKQTMKTLLNFIYCVDKHKIELILTKIKNYSKNSGDLINYLYLYNMFSL